MATDDAGLTDEVFVELNPAPDDTEPPPQLPALPERPADDADRSEWVTYVVALGADASFVEAETEHWEGPLDSGEPITLPALTDAELVELADSLGG